MRTYLLPVLAAILALCDGFVILKNKSYIQLNDKAGGKSINASTYNRLVFDDVHSILYVTAKEPRRLTAYSIDSFDSPSLLAEHVFSAATEGMPLDIDLCYPSGQGGVPRLAISFLDPVSASNEGEVRFYQPLTPLDTELKLIKKVTVGPEPVDMEFAQNCGVLVVANRGRPTKEGTLYRDPEGTVSKVNLPHDLSPDSPITSTSITFGSALVGDFPVASIEELQAKNFRHYPVRDPSGAILSIMQSIEPERVVISPNGQTAYVSMPKNNAIARLSIQFNRVSHIFPLGNRSWINYHLDPSDRDHKINLRGYNIHSFRQATEMLWLTKGGNEWVVTLDTGKLNYLAPYRYADHARAKSLVQKGVINTADQKLKAQLLNDTELGRLFVSTEDGKGLTGKVEEVYTFGGRGFSIRNGEDFETPSVVVDSVEQETERYYSDVFNTAYANNGHTPQGDKEATSPVLGPDLGAMALGEVEGRTVLFIGGGSSGILYVYMLSPDSRCLQPYFHSIHRTGNPFDTWQASYTAGTMGDIGITDMMFVWTPNIRPMLVVTGASSNSVSIYEVTEGDFTPSSVNNN